MENNEKIMDYAWNTMSGKWLKGVGAFAIYFLIFMAICIPGCFVREKSVQECIWNVVSSLLNCVLWFGIIAYFLDVARKVDLSYSRLFTGFRSVKYFFKVAVTIFVQYIFIVLWSLLLIVPGIMKNYSYTMTELVLLDHPEDSPLQAIDESKKMMYGNRWKYFCLQARFWAWMLLCFVTFGIAAFWVMPYFMTAKSKFYMELKENR
jgi:uncharacterized membrane protein